MKTLVAIVATLGLSSILGVAQNTNTAASLASPPKRISAVEAEKHYDETVIVTGKVAQVSIRSKLVYVNLDKRYPASPMSCVVFARATNQFGDLKKLEGKQVEVKGKVEKYQSKPQIILNSSNQLSVIEMPAEPGESKKK